MEQLRAYYYLTKPGIVYSNTLMAVAGFLLASRWRFHWPSLVALAFGVALVIASACVYNNYIDRRIDARMKRTKRRALVSGVISGPQALVFATVLLVLGFGLLSLTNLLTVLLGVVAIVSYVVVYGYAKRHSVWGTLVGTIPGSLPPVAGYAAVAGHLDAAAGVLFLIMTVWQMPHFYAIAMFRRSDYAAAKLPVLPVVHGMGAARRQIIGFIAALIFIAPLLALTHATGILYACVALGVTVWWLVRAVRSWGLEDEKWARKQFGGSLVVLLTLIVAIALGSILV